MCQPKSQIIRGTPPKKALITNLVRAMMSLIKMISRNSQVSEHRAGLFRSTAVASIMLFHAILADADVLVGPFDWPIEGAHGYTLTRSVDSGNILERAKEKNVKVLWALKASRRHYSTDGCFDYDKWERVFNKENLQRIRKFYSMNVIIGFYGIDEPHDWEACGPTADDLIKMCKYAKKNIENIPCGYNVDIEWLSKKGGMVHEFDFIYRQSNTRKTKDWSRWLMKQKKLLHEIKYHGKLYVGINAYTGEPSDSEVSSALKVLCKEKPDAVLLWKWQYIKDLDLSEAVEYCRN